MEANCVLLQTLLAGALDVMLNLPLDFRRLRIRVSGPDCIRGSTVLVSHSLWIERRTYSKQAGSLLYILEWSLSYGRVAKHALIIGGITGLIEGDYEGCTRGALERHHSQGEG